MASRTLFEALTGYEEPATAGLDTPQILGAGAAEPAAASEPSEDQFEDVLARLQTHSESDPRFAKKLADAFGVPADPLYLQAKLQESKEIVEQARGSGLLGPGGAPDWSVQEQAIEGPELLGIPADFGDRYIEEHVAERYWRDLPRINLEPALHRFEDDNTLGILGWLVFNGLGAIEVPRSLHPPFPEQFGRIKGAENFRRHTSIDDFVHPLAARSGSDRIRVALFADFGTGLAHSHFIARQIALDENGFDAAVHLGDVYYTGTPKQYREYFEEPLAAVLDRNIPLFVIPDNHDGYSGFHAYVDFLDRRLQQTASYFAIETEHVQLIGVDTIWHSDRGRIQDSGVREWLKARFEAGRAAGRANVLLTGHEPYNYEKTDLTHLNEDVLSLANGSVSLWFWGNTHYCALFDRTGATPYYGSCIGHAGYPYHQQPTKAEAKPSAAPVLFVESGSRYEGSDVRADRGMNGFGALEISPDGQVELRYRDWRGHERCIAKFAKGADGLLQSTGVEDLVAS